MAVINIGNEAINRISYIDYNKTLIDGTNPASASGRLTSVSIYAAADMFYTVVAIFYRPDPTGYPNNFTARCHHSLGTVPAGLSNHDVDLEVEEGDYIGVYFQGSGRIDSTGVGGTFWNNGSNQTGAVNVYFTGPGDSIISLGATGLTPAAPTVTTVDDACKDRQSTTLTAIGNVTVIGGGYTFRGFEYYQYTEEGEYDSSMWAVREIGTFTATGEFEMTLYGLKPLTCYRIRAFAGNVFGISYGDWVICCTTEVPPVPSYGIHEEDNSEPDSDGTYAGGNTISFYVRKVGGKWSKKYGPYHSDQVDIAVADVMIEGTGKYQVKFESGVLTGISTQVMCKLDIRAR